MSYKYQTLSDWTRKKIWGAGIQNNVIFNPISFVFYAANIALTLNIDSKSYHNIKIAVYKHCTIKYEMTEKILCTNMALISQSQTATTLEKQIESKDRPTFP